MAKTYQYGVMKMTDSKSTSYSIYRGKTMFSALSRAREWVVNSSTTSRAEYEEELDREVTDEEWLKIMETAGFTVAPVELMEVEE